jgi:mono/diheme cytochrome c family protein
MTARVLGIWLLGGGCLGAWVTSAHPGSGVSPIAPASRLEPRDDEAWRDRLLLGERTYTENCLICHGEELASHQRLSAAQWRAEVTKMIGWGAPVPAEEVDRLVEYLSATYPSDRPPAIPERIAPEEIADAFRQRVPEPMPGRDASRGQALHQQHCATCHGAEALGGDLGQNLVNVPALLDREAFARIVRGGRRRMPGFGLVLNTHDIHDILTWLLEESRRSMPRSNMRELEKF